VWGTTWIGIKISLEGLPPFLGASIRFSIALIFLAVFIRIKRISLRISKRLLGIISLSAFLMYTLDYGLIYWGEQYLSAGVTSIFFATFPLFTGISAIFLLKNEMFSWNKFIGLMLGLVGVAIVFLDQLLQTEFDRQVILGSFAIIMGAASGAMSVVLVKKYLSSINPVALSFYQMIQGIVFLYVIGFSLERSYDLQVNLRVGLAVVYLGAVGSALAFALYYWLLQKWSAVSLSVIVYIIPIVALIVDYLVLSEVIHPRAVLGMLVIFSGVAFVQLRAIPWNRLSGKRKRGAV
jgi:drug/metabolite transporter (DMT)-like permease